MKKIIDKLLHPKGATLFLIYILSILFVFLSLYTLIINYIGVLAYIIYAFAAVGLSYAVYITVIYLPGLRTMVTNRINDNKLGNILLSDRGLRTLLSVGIGFVVSIANALINAVAGITSHSIWFGALAAYYMMLAFLRGALLLGSRKKACEDELKQVRNYRNAGFLLLVLNIALSSAIAQMIFDDRSFEYRDWLVYAFAAYAFYKITMAIINVFKAHMQDSLTVQGIRNINLVDGAVSILALQTALLHAFGEGDVNISLYNTLTGSAVSLFALGFSIFMIVKGNRKIKEIKDGK